MSLKQRIDADVKSAMLARDSERVDVLRGLKGAILNEEITTGQREAGLDDDAVERVIAREIKKREEAAQLYDKGGNAASADKERAEKEMLSAYLPQQLSDEELEAVVKTVLDELGEAAHMGKAIGAVKQKVGTAADGARIAAAVQRALKQ